MHLKKAALHQKIKIINEEESYSPTMNFYIKVS